MKHVFLFILIVLSMSLYAQEAVSPAGSNASGSGGAVSYTLGQVSYTSAQGSNGSLVQGVQQAYEITVITSLAEARGITLQWTAYPNPASDFLKLSLLNEGSPEPDFNSLRYQLFDFRGKLLLDNLLEGSETIISMQSFSSGTYILKISEKKCTRKSKGVITPSDYCLLLTNFFFRAVA